MNRDGRTDNDSIVYWFIATLSLEILHLPHDTLAVDNFAKNNVLLVQVRGRHCRDEELGAIRT